MGCRCGGSTQAVPGEFDPRQNIAREERNLAASPTLRAGGPGTPGYVWSGPVTPEPAAEPEPDPAE